jgi:hypothetical protein
MVVSPPTTTLLARVPPSVEVAPIVTWRTVPGHLSFGISIGIVPPILEFFDHIENFNLSQSNNPARGQ